MEVSLRVLACGMFPRLRMTRSWAARSRGNLTHGLLYRDFVRMASAHKRPVSELEKWTETEAAAAGGSTAGPGRCTTWSAPNAGSRRRCPSSPMGRDPSTAKSASRSGARGGSRTGAKADGLRTTFRLRRPRAAGAILSFFDWRAGAPNAQIARPRSVPRGRDRDGSRRRRSG